MFTPPYEHPLDLTTQSVLTFGSWGVTLLLLAIAIMKCRRDGSPFYVLLILAGMVAAFAEPIYDVGMMLHFYEPGQWTAFSAFGIPQPVWTFSGYVVLYSGTAMFICEAIRRGLSRTGLYRFAAASFLASFIFESYGINGGAYGYWGPHTLRVFDYPLVIGILETAQVVCFSVAASELRARTRGVLPLFALFPLFLCTFYLANFGAGSPVIIALHLDQPSALAVLVASLISIGFALLLIRGAASRLPELADGSVIAPRPAMAGA